MAGAATPALAALAKAGVPHEVVKFEHDPRESSFGVEAVDALTRAGPEPASVTLRSKAATFFAAALRSRAPPTVRRTR